MRRGLVVPAAVLLPASAQAHLVVTGVGPVYDGIAHFALSPEDFLPVIALALYVGLRGSAHARLLFWTIPGAWFAGATLAFSALAPSALSLDVLTAAAFLVIGGLLASNLGASKPVCFGVGGATGLIRGMADFAAVSPEDTQLRSLLGVCAAIVVVYAIATSLTLPLKRFWMITAVRVCGSWLAAIGLLLGGWIWRCGAVL